MGSGSSQLIAASHPEAIHALNWAGSELDENYVSQRQVPTNMTCLRQLLHETGVAA